MTETPEWFASAVCLSVDPDLFFPETGAPSRAAKTVCAGCDVRLQCLDYALDNRERWGVWGGLSETQRRRFHATRRAA